jgi:hypothetical protein
LETGEILAGQLHVESLHVVLELRQPPRADEEPARIGEAELDKTIALRSSPRMATPFTVIDAPLIEMPRGVGR